VDTLPSVLAEEIELDADPETGGITLKIGNLTVFDRQCHKDKHNLTDHTQIEGCKNITEFMIRAVDSSTPEREGIITVRVKIWDKSVEYSIKTPIC